MTKNRHGLPVLSIKPHVSRVSSAKRRRWLQLRLNEQNHRCHWCKTAISLPDDSAKDSFDPVTFDKIKYTRLATSDHVVPLGAGGKDALYNIVAACSEV
jgi:hypothetical protein